MSESRGSHRSTSVESFKVMDVLRRANELQAAGNHVLHCEVGQPETGAPAMVSQAAVQALLEPQVMGYTDAFGLLALRQKIQQHYQEYYSKDNSSPDVVSTDRIVITTGSSGAFLLAFTACFDVGDQVAIASSGYPCYRNILNALGCQVVTIPVNEHFKLTATELSQTIQQNPSVKGLILSSPSNPTGAMLTPDELRELCAVCEENGIQFISDEIYHGISYGAVQEATALEFSQKALIINSFSKYYSMSGWRLGWMVVPEHLIDAINKLQQNMFINAPTISQTAAIQCWENETLQELEKHVEKYRTSRSIILDKLSEIHELDPQKNIAPADGGFYVYIDLGPENVAPGYGSVNMCQTLLEEEHVAFTPGTDFEDPETALGDRRFRISYAGGIETVRLAMERFQRFWPRWLERVQQGRGE